MRRTQSKARLWKLVIVAIIFGCCSALLSAWGPVAYWAIRSPNLYDMRAYVDHAPLPELASYPEPGLSRGEMTRFLVSRENVPTLGLAWEWIESPGAAAAEGHERYVMECAAMRAGWPWTTMRGTHALIGEDQINNPGARSSQRYTSGVIWLPSHWISKPAGFFSGGFGAQEWFLPGRPTWGFAVHAALVAGLIVLTKTTLIGLRGRLRLRRGLCPKCRYAIHAPEGRLPRCPECGKEISGLGLEGPAGAETALPEGQSPVP